MCQLFSKTIFWQPPSTVVLSLGWFPPGRGKVYKRGVDFTLREIFCIQGRNIHWAAYYMFYSSVYSVYRHQLVYAEAEGEVHFTVCFLKVTLWLSGSWFYSNWLPQGARENPWFWVQVSLVLHRKVRMSAPWRPTLPPVLGADPEVQRWWVFVFVFFSLSFPLVTYQRQRWAGLNGQNR